MNQGGYQIGSNQGRGNSGGTFSQPFGQFNSSGNLNQTTFSPSFGRDNSSENQGRIICQICNRPGHVALDCYNRLNLSFQGRHPPSKLVVMAVANDPSPSTATWFADSGCNTHVTPDISGLALNSNYNGEEVLTVANGQGLPATQAGFGTLLTSQSDLRISGLLCVPDLSAKLLFVSQCCIDNNCIFVFDADWFYIQDKATGRILYKGKSKDGLYPVSTIEHKPGLQSSNSYPSKCASAFVSHLPQSILWHNRLGHPYLSF